MLRRSAIKYMRRSVPGYMEEKTCPLTFCSLFPPPSLPLCSSYQLQNAFIDCILLQMAWLCWIMKQILSKCQFNVISIMIEEESFQFVQQASSGLPEVLETNQILYFWHDNGK